uniref:Minor tail protein n=2 Tax=unclassified bacterial viruses TaxID=12333 RepID=A0AAU7J811_9VIRU
MSTPAVVADEPCITLHRVMIKDRGGERHVDELRDITQLVWNRERSKTSRAEIIVSGAACQSQRDLLNDIADATHRYEVVIYRGNDRVWEGPIIQTETGASIAVIVAHDGKEYWDNTPLSQDWPISTGATGGPSDPVPMTNRIETIIEWELTTDYQARIGTGSSAEVVTIPRWEQLDPPINMLLHLDVRHSPTLYTRSDTVAFQMQLGEHLDALSEGNLDYCVIGRRVVIWDSAYAIGRTRTLTESDFYGDVRVIAAGTDHSIIGHVSATRPDNPDSDGRPLPPVGPGVVRGVGNAGRADDYYGVWTRLTSSNEEEGGEEPTQDELNSQASRTIAGRTPVPVEIRIPDGAGIRLGPDLSIQHLVPGVIMPVLANLNIRRIAQDQRLDSVRVTETPAGEQINVSLTSAGPAMEVAP